ncbi:hypothetical protein [Sinosporangium siamense]|uniref:Uncharacterized protein n=1 Tax=Sinosporangium siamense TaxID=1367973 RepID=A0A919RSN9_9ACTN|nr:hypothetical protein [Sinosporangium siamense]GII97569.1 hypothetical protein Ssi02_78000 [Sinosporangium siamense]
MATLVAAASAAGVEQLDLGRVPSAGFLGARDNRLDEPEAAARIAQVLSGGAHRLTYLDLRHTGMTSRGALHLLAGAQRAVIPTKYTLGGGIASRVKRELNALAAVVPPAVPHPEVAAVLSVHRTSPGSA